MSDRTYYVPEWYRQRVRPLLAEVATELIPEFDRHLERVEALAAAVDDEVAVCFLGPSSVGKSTLINALVAGDGRVLPQGGIGPLTALATSVHFADDPYFEVRYQPRWRLNRLRFALEAEHERMLRSAGSEVPAETDAEATGERLEEPAVLEGETDSTTESLIMSLTRQARLIVQGSQHGDIDVPYL